MMAWMAKKSDIGDYGCARNLGTGAQGGGGRRAKPLLQSKLGRKGLKGIVERYSSRTLNHLTPRGWGDFVYIYIYIYIFIVLYTYVNFVFLYTYHIYVIGLKI